MTRTSYQKGWRDAKKAKGLCPRCGHRQAYTGHVSCKPCLTITAKRHKQLKQQGICGRCSVRPTLAGYSTCKPCLKRYREANARKRRKAMIIIAKARGQTLRCLFKLTLPAGHPLREFSCYGDLWIDHIHGDGRRERLGHGKSGRWLYSAIVKGKREVDDLSVLCQLHQLWNQGRARTCPAR